MGSDTRKLAMMMFFKEERGCSSAIAGRAVLAMMPLDDGYEPSRGFEKGARKLAKQFSKQSKHASPDELDRLATETLNAIKALAVEHGEGYYSQRYDAALNS
jgi:hypothetical protein